MSEYGKEMHRAKKKNLRTHLAGERATLVQFMIFSGATSVRSIGESMQTTADRVLISLRNL